MFDEFRTQSEEETPQEEMRPPKEMPESPARTRKKSGGGMFLGMSAVQRFVIALLVFFMTCILGAFCLIITERVVLPIF